MITPLIVSPLLMPTPVLNTNSEEIGDQPNACAPVVTWLQESGDKKGKLPARYKRFIALAGIIAVSVASLVFLQQGLISNTTASFHGRLIKAELSEYSTLLQMSCLSIYLFAALIFDSAALNKNITAIATLAMGTLAIDSLTKQIALYAKNWMKPKIKGKNLPIENLSAIDTIELGLDRSTSELALQPVNNSSGLARFFSNSSVGRLLNPSNPILKWLSENGDENPKTPPRYKRYGALIAAETATLASAAFLGQGIVTMTSSLFHGRLVKAETKEWSLSRKMAGLAGYTALSAGLDLAVLRRPWNNPADWIATSIALSISLKIIAELTQKWMNPNLKAPKIKAVQIEDISESEGIVVPHQDIESAKAAISQPFQQSKYLNPDIQSRESLLSSSDVRELMQSSCDPTLLTSPLLDHLILDDDNSQETALIQANPLKRTWNWLLTGSAENRPSRLACYSSIVTSTALTVLSVLFLGQGLISKTGGMFQGRLLKAEISGPNWTKKKQYLFLTAFVIGSLAVDNLLFKRSLINPANFVMATIAINLLVKIAAIDSQRLMNPNFVDDEDDDETPQVSDQDKEAKKAKKKNKKKAKEKAKEKDTSDVVDAAAVSIPLDPAPLILSPLSSASSQNAGTSPIQELIMSYETNK